MGIPLDCETMSCFISESIRDGDYLTYLTYLTYLRVVGVWTGKVGKVTDSNPGPWVAAQACVMPTNGPSTDPAYPLLQSFEGIDTWYRVRWVTLVAIPERRLVVLCAEAVGMIMTMIMIQIQHGRCGMEMKIWGDVSVPWKVCCHGRNVGDKGWEGQQVALGYAPIRAKCCDRPSPQVQLPVR